MKPTIGPIVYYQISESDVTKIALLRRTRFGGEPHREPVVGEVLPMMIVVVHGDHPNAAVNGQVFLDGDDTYHVTSRLPGVTPGTYAWPVVPPAEPIGVAYGDRQ